MPVCGYLIGRTSITSKGSVDGSQYSLGKSRWSSVSWYRARKRIWRLSITENVRAAFVPSTFMCFFGTAKSSPR